MKFAYEGVDTTTIIKGYQIKNNQLVIKYLNGKKNILPYSALEERKVLDMMVRQALDRKENFDLKSFSYSAKEINKTTNLGFLLYLLTIILELIPNRTSKSIGYGAFIAGNVELFTALFSNLDFKRKLDELEKYEIYLNMINLLSFLDNPKIYAGVKNKNKLTINTLDNFSLQDVETVEENVRIAFLETANYPIGTTLSDNSGRLCTIKGYRDFDDDSYAIVELDGTNFKVTLNELKKNWHILKRESVRSRIKNN